MNFNLEKPITSYSHVNLEKLITLYSYANLQKNVFLYKKHTRNYIQLNLQPDLSEVYSEHFFFFYNIFFTKSKIILLILLNTFFCLLAAYLRKMFTNLIKLHHDAFLKNEILTQQQKRNK